MTYRLQLSYASAQMCVNNRSNIKLVRILDDAQPCLFEIAHGKRHETIVAALCSLLNSGFFCFTFKFAKYM